MVDGFKIVDVDDVIEDLLDYRVTYNDKGKYLGFDEMNEYYTMQLGNCTDWSGYPGSGKTQLLMEVLLNTSKLYDWVHFVYLPDVGSSTEIVADLLHKITGKTFNPKYLNHISDDEIKSSLNWVLKHFLILTKKDVKAKLTPFQFYDMAAELKKTRGIHTASIDSWKDMSHDYNKYGSYATYLEIALPYRNKIAEDNNIHIHTIIHPKLVEKENGKRRAPSPHDLKGGSEWFNSGKCMITVHRETGDTNEAQIIFGKIKPRSIGKKGQISLFLDLEKFVYYEHTDQGKRRYAQVKGNNETLSQPELNPIETNDDFMNPNKFPF